MLTVIVTCVLGGICYFAANVALYAIVDLGVMTGAKDTVRNWFPK